MPSVEVLQKQVDYLTRKLGGGVDSLSKEQKDTYEGLKDYNPEAAETYLTGALSKKNRATLEELEAIEKSVPTKKKDTTKEDKTDTNKEKESELVSIQEVLDNFNKKYGTGVKISDLDTKLTKEQKGKLKGNVLDEKELKQTLKTDSEEELSNKEKQERLDKFMLTGDETLLEGVVANKVDPKTGEPEDTE